MLEASFVFGFDDHSPDVFEQTLAFVKDCSPCVPTFNLLTPYPGTALFRQFEEQGRLLHRDWSRYNHAEVVFRPRLMSPEQLKSGWLAARREAYRWPAIFDRVWKSPGHRLGRLAYNVLRKGPNSRPEAPS
jgi:radical SAM superfamily enzyme YgiQ (UPF0313 family)